MGAVSVPMTGVSGYSSAKSFQPPKADTLFIVGEEKVVSEIAARYLMNLAVTIIFLGEVSNEKYC
jgi:hypothetical protein